MAWQMLLTSTPFSDVNCVYEHPFWWLTLFIKGRTQNNTYVEARSYLPPTSHILQCSIFVIFFVFCIFYNSDVFRSTILVCQPLLLRLAEAHTILVFQRTILLRLAEAHITALAALLAQTQLTHYCIINCRLLRTLFFCNEQ